MKSQPIIDWNPLIMDQLSSGIVLLDNSLRTVFCNTSAATMLGYQLQDIVGNLFADFVFPCIDANDTPIEENNFPPSLTAQSSIPIVNFPLSFHQPDGKQVWILMSSQIVNQGEANDRKLLVTLNDISALHEGQKHKTSVALEQERANMIGQFVQSASHEFRTPLSIIQLNLDLLVKQKIDTHLFRYIDQANTQIERLVRLVDTLLMIAELDSWNSLPLQKTSVNHILNLLLDKTSRSDEIQERILEIDLDSDLPPVLGNDYYLITALAEIIGNAIRHTNLDSTISIRAKSNNKTIDIIIEDKGIGINTEEVRHVFKRFWRKDKMHNTPGFGLGLPLARRIIDLHYGEINLESTQNGTKVTVSLPEHVDTLINGAGK